MKLVKLRGALPLVFIFFSLSLVLYDKFLGFDDGFIKGIAFKRVLFIAGSVVFMLWLCSRGIRSKNRALQNLSLFSFSLLLCLFIIELFSFVCFRIGIVKASPPRHHLLTDAADLNQGRLPFWGDYNSDFSKWYLPHDTLKRANCEGDSLFSYTNAFGARDSERQKQSAKSRVALQGDSFIEGFMVNTDQRMSDLLEQNTGIEHLNFGINGTSPINYYLTYKHLVKQFDHDVLLVGILPANDFEDFTAKKIPSLVESPIHRPYWDGAYPDYTLRYSLASIAHSAHSLQHFNHPGQINTVIDSVFCQLPVRGKVSAFLQDNVYTWHLIQWIGQEIRPAPPADFTRFNTFSTEEWNIFSYSLERLFEEARDKRVILLLLPILSDVKAYDLKRETRLAGALDSLIQKHPHVGVIDFLPIIHARSGKWDDLYVPCDGHWSKEGERFASEVILNHPLYTSALRRDTIKIQDAR